VKLQVTFETGHPSRLEGLDGIVSPVYSDERPLRGVAGHADWRLNGFLSRLMMEERLRGDSGEWLLVHTQGRLPYTHLFLVGMGRKGERNSPAVKKALGEVATKVALAGLHAFGIDLHEVAGDAMTAEEALVCFLENLSSAYPEDGLSDPPYRPAIEVSQRNEERAAEARARRARLAEARAQWEAEAAAAAADLEAEETLAESGEDDSAREDLIEATPQDERPRAGAVPAASSDGEVPSLPDPPPHPSTIEEPELEDEPERTVRVVLLGNQEQLGAMRQALRDWRPAGDGELDVEWSR
jgi:hypothetical protein